VLFIWFKRYTIVHMTELFLKISDLLLAIISSDTSGIVCKMTSIHISPYYYYKNMNI